MWIEISRAMVEHYRHASLPARGVWIEMTVRRGGRIALESLPARGVWIEIESG